MAIKKYIDLSNLTKFLDNLKNLFATKTEMNAKSDKTHTHSIDDVANLQSTLNGKANSSHGTHVTYSTIAPVMDGTASVGSANSVARSDHRHPTDTSRASQTNLDSHTSNTTYHITSAERANWNAAYTHSQTAHAPSNAEPNQNAFSNVKIGDVTISADIKTDTLTLVAGNNITITPDASNDKITISAKDTTYTLGSFGINAAASEINKLKGVTANTEEINYLDGVTSNIQTQLDEITSKVDNQKAKRVSLTGQCQLTSYRTSVIALCKAPTDAYCGGANKSYSSGQLSFARSNGLYAPTIAIISMSSSHGGTNRVITRYLCSSGFSIFKPCTFTYNGVVYGGLEVKTNDAEAHNVTFVGETTFDIFALDIYDSNQKAILNEEVYNSISYDNVIVASGWKDSGYSIITSETIGSQSVASATKDGNGNVISSTYETKTDASNKLATSKTYADNAATTAANNVKNDLLNGAGAAYDTLKELGDLIDDNTDAIDALETVAAGKANKTHTHAISDITNLQSNLNGKSDSGHTHNNIVSRGNIEAETESTRPSVNGISMTQAYNNGYATTYGNILNLKGQGDGQLLIGWSGTSGAHAPVYVRSKRDVSDAKWSDWAQIYTTAHKPTPSDIGAASSSHTHKVANISDLTASATELNYVKGVTSGIQTQLDGKALSGHTHSYAGSSSVGGAATSANKLNTDAGSATQPVYFSNGIPVKTTYTLGKSVPSDAKFTDTTYSVATTSANGLMSSTDKKRLDSISGSYSLGSFASKTVADLQTALDTWLNSYVNIANASAKFQASQDWVTAWNSGNTASTISAGGTWTVTNIAPYSTKAYAQLRISYYSDEWVVYVHRSNGTWGAAHQAAYKDDLTLKQDTIVGGASTIAASNLTANRALISNGSGKVAVSAVTSTELGYLDGVTSGIQAQLDGKSSTSHTHNYAGSSSVGGVANSANKLATARTISLTGDVTGSTSFDGSGNVSIITTVADDSHNHTISNVDNLQTTLDAKLPKSGGTVGALTGSSTIAANGTLSGNADTKTPFSTTTDLYYVNKKLTWNSNSYLQHVILLLPVLTSTNWFGYNYIEGKFLCWKNGGNVYDTVEISANCVYNSLRYHLEYFGDNPSWGLCICKYNGVSYYAINCPYHANPYTNVEFIGHIRSELSGGTSTVALPLDIPYYNENTSTVLNEEVRNSITNTLTTTIVTSASGTPLYSKNGFTGNLNGNATTASSCTGNSATATKLSSAKTISLTGDVTGSASFDGSANASITATVADDSHNHIISNVDGLQTALDGKSATSHNHNSAYISKDLQFTADNGSVIISVNKDDGKNILTEIGSLPVGFYTVYSQSGTAGNPKTTEAWRFMVHKTGANTGWVQGYGSIGSVYTNYQDGATTGWRGWKCIWDNDPNPLWSGQMYMSSPNSTPQTVTPSKKLSECRTGWLLLWSDYDPGSGSNDADFATTVIPKNNPSGGTWGGKSFLCDIPRYIGSNTDDVDTERRIIKVIYVHDDCIKGSYQGDADERNDVVLRAVYEI